MKLLFDQNLSPRLAYHRYHGRRFSAKGFLSGHPPKVVWVRLGNCSTRATEALLKRRAADIEEFLTDPQKSFLYLS